jgi:hypothetical protein
MLWVQVLNRGLAWERGSFGGATRDPQAAVQLGRDLGLLRAVYSDRVLGGGLGEGQAAGLRQWLAAVTLRAEPATSPEGFDLPAIRAARARSSLPALFETLLSTALVELLATGDEAVRAVSRCHGLVRETAGGPFAPEHDRGFARLAALDGHLGHGFCQCPKLVHGPRQAHYCSKACSNVAFAVRKGSRDPHYFAAKQAHYRERQRREAARVDRAAVLFVD